MLGILHSEGKCLGKGRADVTGSVGCYCWMPGSYVDFKGWGCRMASHL